MKKWMKSINVYTRKLFVYKFIEKSPYCGETQMIEVYQSAYGAVTAVKIIEELSILADQCYLRGGGSGINA